MVSKKERWLTNQPLFTWEKFHRKKKKDFSAKWKFSNLNKVCFFLVLGYKSKFAFCNLPLGFERIKTIFSVFINDIFSWPDIWMVAEEKEIITGSSRWNIWFLYLEKDTSTFLYEIVHIFLNVFVYLLILGHLNKGNTVLLKNVTSFEKSS